MINPVIKYIFTCAIMLCIHNISLAQSYTITPNDTLTGEATPDQLTIFDIYMDNTTGTDTLIVHWERISLDIPDEWDYSLCDLGTCYPGIPDGGTMYPVEPGQQGFLGFNVFPLLVSGSTTLVMRVWEESMPDDADTLVWIISSDFGSSLNSVSENSISVYPTITDQNITVDHIQGNNSRFALFDLNGKTVLHEMLTAGINTIYVGDLSGGYYTAAAVISGSSVMKTQSIIIQ